MGRAPGVTAVLPGVVALVFRRASGDPSVVATYVVPMLWAKAAAAGAVNLAVLLVLLATMVANVSGPSATSPASWAIWAGFTAVVVANYAWNHRQVRRRHYLVRRPSLLGAPAGAYPVRPKGEQR